jgi:hypothetical protein
LIELSQKWRRHWRKIRDLLISSSFFLRRWRAQDLRSFLSERCELSSQLRRRDSNKLTSLHSRRIVVNFCRTSYERERFQNYKNRNEFFFLQMNSFRSKILIEFSTFFFKQMILFVAVNTFNKKRTRDFIAEKCERHIRDQHVLKKHILKKHWKWFWVEHERLIWRRITRKHIWLIILTWFKIVSIIEKKNTIY